MLGILMSGMIVSCSKNDDNNDEGVIDANNRNSNIAFGKSEAMRLEVPALRRGSGIYFVTRRAAIDNRPGVGKTINYCIEYDSTYYHSRWVAFCFDDTTRQRNVSRSDVPYQTDPFLPARCRLQENGFYGSGYDHGHLCASADRLFSTEANEQTFYMTNMSPQIHNFNGGYWVTLEGLVRDWSLASKNKRLYVCKGGTIRTDQQLRTTNAYNALGKQVKVAVPKYYFMAILAETHNQTFQSIGFLLEHKDYGYNYNSIAPKELMKQHAVSIDELEEFTGIDFFCNLNDALENAVEKNYSLSAWSWR